VPPGRRPRHHPPLAFRPTPYPPQRIRAESSIDFSLVRSFFQFQSHLENTSHFPLASLSTHLAANSAFYFCVFPGHSPPSPHTFWTRWVIVHPPRQRCNGLFFWFFPERECSVPRFEFRFFPSIERVVSQTPSCECSGPPVRAVFIRYLFARLLYGQLLFFQATKTVD